MNQLEFNIRPKRRQTFQEFDQANPWVLPTLRAWCLEAVAAGDRRLSIREFWERLRHDPKIAKSGRKFKLDNNHAPEYARILDGDPALRGRFEFRKRKAEARP